MYSKSIAVLLVLVLSANALTTPIHGVRLSHRHSSIAKARSPAPAPEPAPVVASPVSKRGLKKRCKARTPPSSLTLSSSAAAAPSIGSGIGNVGADPNSTPAPAPSAPPKTTEAAAPASSSAAPAPASSSAAPAPPPPPPPKPSPTSGGGGGGGGGACSDSNIGATGCTHTGQGTFYETGLTACGITNNDSQFIVAVSEQLFDQFTPGGNPNKNSLCNRQAKVTYQGKTITVTITDRCVACALNDLDFTPTAFQALGADLGTGRINGVQWEFIN